MSEDSYDGGSDDGLHKKRMTPNDDHALSLYQLIGAPLHALVDAERQSTQATADFLREFGFEGGDDPAELGELRMARFRQPVRGANGEVQDMLVEVPFLSLVPIPALQIRDATLDFNVKIIDVRGCHSSGMPELEQDQVSFSEQNRVDLKATLGRDASANTRASRSDIHIRMKVNVEQADMPVGLSRLMNIMDQNITTTALPARRLPEQDDED